MSDSHTTTEDAVPKMKDYPWERTIFGVLVIGGVVAIAILLFFQKIPTENAQIVPILIGALTASLGIIVQAVWKTSMTERQQQATIQALAASAAAPLTTTQTTTTERTGTDGPQSTGADALTTGGVAGDSGRGIGGGGGVVQPAAGGNPTGAVNPTVAEPPWASPDGVGSAR